MQTIEERVIHRSGHEVEQPAATARARRPRYLAALALAAAAAVVGPAYAVNAGSVNHAFELATGRHDRPFTELYFSSVPTLQHRYRAGSELPVSFAVRNVEGRDLAYDYTVDVGGQVLARGTTSVVPAGGRLVVQQKVRLPRVALPTRLTVALAPTGQTIHVQMA